MHRPNVLTVAQAQAVMAERTGGSLVYSQRQMRRWANTGRAGGFRSQTTGRLLFRTSGLIRALTPTQTV